MKYYIASISTNDGKLLEHYYVAHDKEDLYEKVAQSIIYSKLENQINKIEMYSHDFTIYDDELQAIVKEKKAS